MTEPKAKPQQDPESGRFLPMNRGPLKHGGWAYLRSGRLPSVRGRRRIQHHLSELRQRLMESVPSSEDPRRAALIEQVVKCEGFTLLIEEYLKLAGLLRTSKRGLEPQPVLQVVGRFMDLERKAIQALGLDAKQAIEAIAYPWEIAAEHDKAKTAEKSSQ